MTIKLIKLLLIFFLFGQTLTADINKKINQTKIDLKKQANEQKKISRKLNQIALSIQTEESKLKKINSEILKTKKKIQDENRKTTIKRGELKTIQNLYNDLDKREKEVSKKLIEIISKSISLEMTTQNSSDTFDENSVDNIVLKQMYGSYRTILRNKFSKTKKRYFKLQKNITIVKSELDKIKRKLKSLKTQIKKYDKLKVQKKKSLKKLGNDKSAYLKKLRRIKSEKVALSKTLNKLKITKTEVKQTITEVSDSANTKVRDIGSSYQRVKLEKYTGPKTIAPLKNYTISQKFGTYTDPIYKIKIFNEAVILKAAKRNSRVQNVLDGKVIYADRTSMLEHVVIVQNRDNIHTIFAHLSQIAPTIKVGKKIPKGYVIGRIENELTFEVTKNEKHINPMKLIK
jgi:murein DD-endopeptidase MepM/ murein hydrolase activator NlpD